MNFIDTTSGTLLHADCLATTPCRSSREYRPHVLVLGSLNARQGAFARMLRRWKYAVSVCDADMLGDSSLADEPFDLVVVHLERLDFDVWDSFDRLRRRRPSLPLVVLRDNPAACSWVEVGGTSWILKNELTMAQTQLLLHELAGVPSPHGRVPSIRSLDRIHGGFSKAVASLRHRPRWPGFGAATASR